MTYSEKLKDPRWQKMRLKCFELNNFSCQYCGNKEKTLHAHHLCYSESYNPWDVDEFALMCLCEDCHKVLHLNNLTVKEKLIHDIIISYAIMYQGKNELINFFIKEINSILLNGRKQEVIRALH